MEGNAANYATSRHLAHRPAVFVVIKGLVGPWSAERPVRPPPEEFDARDTVLHYAVGTFSRR